MDAVRLSLVEAGPVTAPAVLLLHGFPEFSYSWRHQIHFLAQAGFRVLAPDLRGYNTSDKPVGVKEYRIDRLVADVINLLDRHQIREVYLAGHDWGGIIAWHVAMWHPERIAKLAILNAPHPAAYLRELRTPSQLMRSWYVFFFQLPWLPELLMRANNFAALRHLFREGPARLSPTPDEDVDRYLAAISRPGALTAMINYYRAAMRMVPFPASRRFPPIHMPTLLIWGCQDRYLTPSLADGLEAWVTRLHVERLPEATHWVQNDAPDKVNRLLGDFFGPVLP